MNEHYTQSDIIMFNTRQLQLQKNKALRRNSNYDNFRKAGYLDLVNKNYDDRHSI